MTTDGDQTRALLLSEARDLYLEAGFARFSLREVARRVGISAPAVYRHYDSKEALLREVCSEGFRLFASYLMRALLAPTARERLGRSIDQYLRFALEHRRDYRVIFMADADEVAPLAPPKTLDDSPTFQFLVDRVKECMQEGVLAKGDADEVAAVIWAHVHGLVALRLAGQLARVGGDAAFKRFYLRATEHLLAGLAPAGSARVNTVHKKER